ncbi:hypothetical protein LA080_014449 [Diaporthe eres]|nr:hypothetical protein LA080_014449 [Diaporthe eres]
MILKSTCDPQLRTLNDQISDADQHKSAAFVDLRSSMAQVQAEKSLIWAEQPRHQFFDDQPPKMMGRQCCHICRSLHRGGLQADYG